MVRHPAKRPTLRLLVSVSVTLIAATSLIAAQRASAGTWTLISCRQPNGQPAPTEAWGAVELGNVGFYAEATNTCPEPGGALVAVSSARWPQPASSGYEWQFKAPEGQKVAGGVLQVGMTAAHGFVSVETPEHSTDPVDLVTDCALSETCGITGSSELVPIDHAGGSSIYADAICWPFSTGCGTGTGVNAQISIYSAEILLEADVSPTASSFSGGLLDPDASGIAHLVFTASVPSGPGIWQVTAAVDGRVVYDQTPDTNSGHCQSVGTGPEGAAEFLYAQPCKQSEAVSIPVNTSEFETGTHNLTVTVTDAAGNTATVFSAPINTFNATSQAPWQVSLRVSPHHVHLHSWINLVGRVSTSPRPSKGKLIYLQASEVTFIWQRHAGHRHRVKVYGEWRTFKVRHTKPEGVFEAKYHFRFGGHHLYAFRAIAPQEGDFAAATGSSAIVEITET